MLYIWQSIDGSHFNSLKTWTRMQPPSCGFIYMSRLCDPVMPAQMQNSRLVSTSVLVLMELLFTIASTSFQRRAESVHSPENPSVTATSPPQCVPEMFVSRNNNLDGSYMNMMQTTKKRHSHLYHPTVLYDFSKPWPTRPASAPTNFLGTTTDESSRCSSI